MGDVKPPAEAENAASSNAKPDVKPDGKAVKPRAPNPIYKYMGLGENFRPRLPSRNWSIFLTIVGTWTAAVVYDKREKKRAQRKWCKLVEHIAKEPLDPKSMPRRLTIFLEAPPADGLRVSQDHFKEYVKPILVASGLDWDFVQGRKEGDIRVEVAEKIRNMRLPADQRAEEDAITRARSLQGIQEFEGPRGDIVIGRHTWKEYVRGLHEGWLGPLTEPPKPVQIEEPPQVAEPVPAPEIPETMPGITIHSSAGQIDPPNSKAETKAIEEEKPQKPPPFISTLDYKSSPNPTSIPHEFDPSLPVSFPHILGFLNTPTRLYRFFNRRKIADSIGRDTAAIILSTYRPYHTSTEAPELASTSPATSEITSEQETTLLAEESAWHKSVHKRVEGEPERTWLEPMVLDARIASRMRRAELTAEDEERAKRIVVPEEEIEGWIKGGIRGAWRSGVQYLGLGQKKSESKAPGEEEVLE